MKTKFNNQLWIQLVDQLGRQLEEDIDKEKQEVYEEIASGLNENRRQLRKLMKAIIAGRVNVVVAEFRCAIKCFGPMVGGPWTLRVRRSKASR